MTNAENQDVQKHTKEINGERALLWKQIQALWWDTD